MTNLEKLYEKTKERGGDIIRDIKNEIKKSTDEYLYILKSDIQNLIQNYEDLMDINEMMKESEEYSEEEPEKKFDFDKGAPRFGGMTIPRIPKKIGRPKKDKGDVQNKETKKSLEET